MQRIATGAQLAALPPNDTPSGTPGYFGSTANGGPTKVGQDWFNDVQEELMAIIAAASITPAVGTRNQVLTAIQVLIAAGTNAFLTDTGAANAYVLTPSPAIGSYANGYTAVFKAVHANTGASTLNVSALGAKAITHRDGTALQNGDIPAGAVCRCVYDGAEFQLEDMIPTVATTLLEGLVALATSAQAIAGSDTSHALTPAAMLAAHAQSLGANGYITLPGGLILQWVRLTSNITVEGPQTITFPIAFPNACFKAFGNALNTSNSASEDLWAQSTAANTTTTATIYLQATSPTPGHVDGVDVFAIGN